MELTDKGIQTVNVGDSLILKALYDDVPLETLPFKPEEIAEMLKELEDGGYICKD